MKRILLFLIMCSPIHAQAELFEAAFAHNKKVVQTQQATDQAVRWINLHGYNDEVAYQFIRRCGWLQIVPGGNDWCDQSTSHRTLIRKSYRQGSRKTIRLLERYKKLG